MSNGLVRKSRVLSILAVGAILLVSYQNCAKSVFSMFGEQGSASSAPRSSVTSNLSGGQGYDGKAFVVLEAGVQGCADGSPVRSKILLRNFKAYLARDLCQNIPLASQPEVVVSMSSPTANVLIYNGVQYEYFAVWFTTGSSVYDSPFCMDPLTVTSATPPLGSSCDVYGSPGARYSSPLARMVNDISAGTSAPAPGGTPAGWVCVTGIVTTYVCQSKY